MSEDDHPVLRRLSYELLGRNGRLGNQLWQIASTVGLSAQRGMSPAFPAWDYQPYFQVPGWMFYEELPTDRDDLGTDYLQELHYFERVDAQVKEMFQPTPLAFQEMYRRYPSFWSKEHVTAVHVRRGDYVGLPDHFPLPTMDYFRRARDLVADQEPDTCFMIFSDDPEWCQENMDAIFDTYDHEYVVGVPRPVEVVDRIGDPEDQFDLQIQAFCDRHILSNSTFSWWGAYLSSDNEIIYPSTWFGTHAAVRDIPWRRMFNDRFREVRV